jgi:hypothetical protein
MKKAFSLFICILGVATVLLTSCKPSSHDQMIAILQDLHKKSYNTSNPFSPESRVAYYDSLLQNPDNGEKNIEILNVKAQELVKMGQEEKAVQIYEQLYELLSSRPKSIDRMSAGMAIAYLRLGERNNCMLNHNGSSCIFPIKDNGVHVLQTGSKKAFELYQNMLKQHPDDMQSKWLLNIAYMTIGGYPAKVPHAFLIPGLNADTGYQIKPFTDMAADLGLNVSSTSGGVIVEDFNNDGYLDIVTSGWELDAPMHYFQNNGDGTFTDRTAQSGLKGITGGLNMQQTDYNNDGNIDIFVLRGAWNNNGFGNQPSSLLRNNGDGTFTDVTISSGLLFYHPTQTAVWADFNNDGWLDVFIGAEDVNNSDGAGFHPSMLYINNHDGTFTNVADKAHCDIRSFVKGVAAADYNNDGWYDIVISTLDGREYLLKNKGVPGSVPDFEDVSTRAGININSDRKFTTFFYDYNNDGWPDILVGDYQFSKGLGYYAAAEALGQPVPDAGNLFLFRNNHDGTFTNVTKEAGLNKVVFSMGGNFGDIDNDGYPDMYFGTGNPDFGSLVPNKLFKNIDGKKFADVTTVSRMGNLQKGHGVAFADFRNIGLQDIFIEMGGAYHGDAYTSSLYVNPGQNNNNWIGLKLEGVEANKEAVGSHIKLTFTENGVKRNVYKDVNSGGSFGSSPFRQEMGIGQAKLIDEIEIKWAGSQTVQRFKNVAPNQFLHITEENNIPEVIRLKKLTFKKKIKPAPVCMPVK